MKLKLHLLLLALCSMVILQSCDDDDDIISITEATQNAFKAKFPTVNNERWENKRGYYVAEWRENGLEKDAWFSTSSEWLMTETDYGRNLSLLPSAVKTALEGSTYQTWSIDDIDFYERPDKDFYRIEVEKKGEREMNLFYATDGTLIKAVEDKENDDILPNTAI